MEYDVLNELLTSTVATLFTNRASHQNYIKTSSQMGQEKDVPTGRPVVTLQFDSENRGDEPQADTGVPKTVE